MNIYFSENVKRMRKEKDLTQETLAEALGVSFQTISKWERGESYPDLSMLSVISSFFSVSVDVLLGIDKAHTEETIKKYVDMFDNMKLKDARSVLSEYGKAVKEFPTAANCKRRRNKTGSRTDFKSNGRLLRENPKILH